MLWACLAVYMDRSVFQLLTCFKPLNGAYSGFEIIIHVHVRTAHEKVVDPYFLACQSHALFVLWTFESKV